MEIQYKQKPWGREIWFAHNQNYAGKILEVKKGHRLSLQYHEKKIETMYLHSGKIKMIFGKDVNTLEQKVLQAGQKFEIIPPTIHRVEALEDSEIFEVSTPELDDIVKLEDDYGRSGTGNNFSTDNQLHKQNFS